MLLWRIPTLRVERSIHHSQEGTSGSHLLQERECYSSPQKSFFFLFLFFTTWHIFIYYFVIQGTSLFIFQAHTDSKCSYIAVPSVTYSVIICSLNKSNSGSCVYSTKQTVKFKLLLDVWKKWFHRKTWTLTNISCTGSSSLITSWHCSDIMVDTTSDQVKVDRSDHTSNINILL